MADGLMARDQWISGPADGANGNFSQQAL